MAIGFSFPFSITTGSLGYFNVTVDELSAIEADIKSLLLTNWGERVMHFDFGCNLREFLFEQRNDSELKLRIADRITAQFDKWLPFVKVQELNILFSDERPEIPENGIGIAIKYRLDSKPDLQGQTSFIVL
ncbi:MAG: GPW/gp25 family protein [Candidatus Thorarchaeota archaeon]